MKTLILILLAGITTAFAQDEDLITETPAELKAGKPTRPVPKLGDPFVKGGAEAPKTAASDNRPTNYQVLFETFDLSREDFLALLDEKGDDDARYRRVAEWMTAGKAKLATFTALTTRSDGRATIESVDKVCYATQWDPPHTAGDFAFPTTFEAMSAGESLELELSSREDGKSVGLNLAPAFRKLVKFVDDIADQENAHSAISQPRTETRSFTTSSVVQLNRPLLTGTLSSANDDGTSPSLVRLAFCTVRPAQLVKPKPESVVKDATQTRLEYTFFSTDRTAARDLYLAKAESQACYESLRALLRDNKARLEHISVNAGIFGQQLRCEEGQNVRYSVEWRPGESISSSASSAKPSQKTPEASREGEVKPEKDGPRSTETAAPRTARVAALTNVETAGFTAESEANLGEDGTTVELNLSLKFNRYLGALEVSGVAKRYPQQPLFETSSAFTRVYATIGQQQLIGTFNYPTDSGANGRKDDGRVWFGFVRPVLVK